MKPRTLKLTAHRSLVYYTPEDVACIRGDAERLEWLISKELVAHRMIDTGLWMIVTGDGCPAIDGSEHETARAAIDAAIKANNP